MAQALDDAYLPAARPRTADDPAKLRDEMNRLTQRLVRARESYDQDLFGGDAEVPLDVQLAVIEGYTARLEVLTEQLRQPEAAPVAAVVPAPQPPGVAPPVVAPPVVAPPAPLPQDTIPEPRSPLPVEAPPVRRPASTGPGITNPDGTPLVSVGNVIRTEDAAIGEYVRYAAELRWVEATRPSLVSEYAAICDAILTALADKHGVAIEDERQSLARQVESRYRRDYG